MNTAWITAITQSNSVNPDLFCYVRDDCGTADFWLPDIPYNAYSPFC